MSRVALADDLELDLGVEKVHTPPSPLALTNEQVARLTKSQREARLDALMEDSARIYANGIERHVHASGHKQAGLLLLFSGGNDSTTVAHMFRDVATHAGHANTTVGIEATRQFVRDTCKSWGLPLLERTPPRERDQYRALVLSKEYDDKGRPMGGFPGPSLHWKMYQRLKLRAIEQMQRELVDGRGTKYRLVAIAGRRRDESRRRATIPESERKGSLVWVSPMVHWTKLDLNTYRLRAQREGDPVPVNDVTRLVHMSGECLCGSYAHPGERAELEHWFAPDLANIAELEATLRTPEYDFIPEWRKTWGWASVPELRRLAIEGKAADELEAKSEGLCQSCADPFQMGLFDLEPA